MCRGVGALAGVGAPTLGESALGRPQLPWAEPSSCLLPQMPLCGSCCNCNGTFVGDYLMTAFISSLTRIAVLARLTIGLGGLLWGPSCTLAVRQHPWPLLTRC